MSRERNRNPRSCPLLPQSTGIAVLDVTDLDSTSWLRDFHWIRRPERGYICFLTTFRRTHTEGPGSNRTVASERSSGETRLHVPPDAGPRRFAVGMLRRYYFLKKCARPVLIKNVVNSSWPALDRWRRQPLMDAFGDERVITGPPFFPRYLRSTPTAPAEDPRRPGGRLKTRLTETLPMLPSDSIQPSAFAVGVRRKEVEN